MKSGTSFTFASGKFISFEAENPFVMTNKEISSVLRLGAKLLDLHGENTFKVRSYESAAFKIERLEIQLRDLTEEEIGRQDGIGDALHKKIIQILVEGTYPELERLKEKTPEGLFELLALKGIGAKKLRVLWQELDINSLEDLYSACDEGRLSGIKGFGKKTQENILEGLRFMLKNRGKFLYIKAEAEALFVKELLLKNGIKGQIEFIGDLRRKCPVIEIIRLLVEENWKDEVESLMDANFKGKGEWRWLSEIKYIPVEIIFVPGADFPRALLLHTGSEVHIGQLGEIPSAPTEEEIYASLGLQYIPPEMREGRGEIELARENKIPELINMQHIKGCLHNHSHYSDGKNSLEQMVLACRDAGYGYFGISDHSQSAYYAGGLKIDKLEQQFAEVKNLNLKYAPFRVFWGIESDILPDGSLDYPDEVLKNFDFIVASIHNQFNMTEAQGTSRLIRAVENPYTTILGHMTGRLLLIRPGYPVNVKKVIDACVANHVAIEINSNPRRLDVDWTFIDYAMNKGAMLSINPDAHHVDEINYMYYGTCHGRKAGLSPEFVLNAKPVHEVEAFFRKKRLEKNHVR